MAMTNFFHIYTSQDSKMQIGEVQDVLTLSLKDDVSNDTTIFLTRAQLAKLQEVIDIYLSETDNTEQCGS